MATRSLAHRGELLLSLGFTALGAYVLYDTQSIAAAQGYDQLGPRLFPQLVGIALAVLGAVLAWHSLSGGWRNVPLDQEGHDNPDWPAFGLIGGGLMLQMAIVGSVGFVIASTLLYLMIARGFGSRRWRRDLLAGVAVVLAAYYLFTLALGLHLTKSPLGIF
jgi:putative tricarboxylic transport membrane protein